MAGNIIGVIAQRLVRVLCPHCKEAYAPAREERLLLGAAGQKLSYVYRPVGCKQCDNKGYKGRTAIMEMPSWTATWTALGAPRQGAHSRSPGLRSLADEGLRG
jgi:type II secretory ATPase GspE/PulE/Tfp pilus assembly ATPase PilB-like protein